jgi:putative endonuclease
MLESYVYIMTNIHQTVLYTGVTGNLLQRVQQHKDGQGGTFSAKYKTTILVYVEIFDDIYDAISREKWIKAGSRKDKVKLIESINPEWKDLSAEL